MIGEHTELDKTVLEKIGDPLVHLVRNAIDHGLETPDKRRAAAKATRAACDWKRSIAAAPLWWRLSTTAPV